MRNTVIWSFLSMVALASGGLMAGCDSDEKLARSALGESCAKTSDCDDGLRCLDGTCYKPSSGTAGSSNGAGGDGAEPTGPKPEVLGTEGQSCSRAADCVEGLGCFSGRCSKAEAGGEGGDSSGGGVKLGGKGETCGLTSDCQKGLACLPSDGQIFPDALAIGSNSVGVCTPTDNGLEPTGNMCGAECKEAADCCELPVAVHVPYASIDTPGVSGPYGTGANSCAQLADLLDKVVCTGKTLTAAQKAQCFAQAAYCECGKNTWACNEAGRCEYTAACVSGTPSHEPGGCAQFTRTGGAAGSLVCNTKTKKCVADASGCAKDADCDETTAVSGTATADVCSNGKCICHVESGLCYRPCGEDLDCPAHYTCDTKTSLCTKGVECDSDAYCVTTYNDINQKCVEGTCKPFCNTDLECNHGVLTRGTSTQICNAKHECEEVGCTSDDQCPAVGGVRVFCTKAPDAAAAGGLVSAITD